MNYMEQNGVVVIGNRVIVNGKELPHCPSKGRNITTINGKTYIDGYEYKNGKWRKTTKALFHKYF